MRVARALVAISVFSWPGQAGSGSHLVTAEPGTLPIVLTVPHGGTQPVPGVPARSSGVTERDSGTIELAERAAARLEAVLGERPYLVVAEFDRKYIDANRAPEEAFDHGDAAVHYHAYHDAIRAFVAELRSSLPAGAVLLDLHGHGKRGFRDTICRGTRNGRTVARLRQWLGDEALVGPDSILGGLASAGWQVFPKRIAPAAEDACFNGGFTVAEYGSHRTDGIDSIQLEIGSHVRRDGVRDRVADALGDAVARFLEAHVLCGSSGRAGAAAPRTTRRAESRAGRKIGVSALHFDVDEHPAFTARDALLILRVALGKHACPPCVCDMDGSGAITAADALRALRGAVGVDASTEEK